MKVLICTPYRLVALCGNSIAAARLRDGFVRHGHDVRLLEDCSDMPRSTVKYEAASFAPDVSLIMHGWRCREAFFGIHSLNTTLTVVSLRGTDINEMIKDAEKAPAIIDILRLADSITVFNGSMHDILVINELAHPEKIRIIPNGLSLPPLNGDYRARLGLPEAAPVMVGLAGIRPIKGIIPLIGHLSELKRHVPDLLYVHAGPIIDKKEGGSFIEACRINPWIIHAGTIPHEEVTSFLRSGTIFVSASFAEGMPHGVREAMFAGVPCLLSLNDGHRSMATDGVEAFFFDDGPSFVENALNLLASVNLREAIAVRGRQRVLEDCRKADEINSYLNLFGSLIERRSPREQ